MRKPGLVCYTNRKSVAPQAGQSSPMPATVREWKNSLRRNQVGHFADLRLLDRALSEAEALAWETTFPHLFFPVLAEEKISSAIEWAKRQRAIKASSSELCFAA